MKPSTQNEIEIPAGHVVCAACHTPKQRDYKCPKCQNWRGEIEPETFRCMVRTSPKPIVIERYKITPEVMTNRRVSWWYGYRLRDSGKFLTVSGREPVRG